MSTQEVLNILNEKILSKCAIEPYHYADTNREYHLSETRYDVIDIIKSIFKENGINISSEYVNLIADKYMDKLIKNVKLEIKVGKEKIIKAYNSGNYGVISDLMLNYCPKNCFTLCYKNGSLYLRSNNENIKPKKIKGIPANWNVVGIWEKENDYSYFYDRYDFSGERTSVNKNISTDIEEIEDAAYHGETVNVYKIPK